MRGSGGAGQPRASKQTTSRFVHEEITLPDERASTKKGRPERKIAISETIIFDLVLAAQKAVDATIALHRARCAFLEEANASKPRRAA